MPPPRGRGGFGKGKGKGKGRDGKREQKGSKQLFKRRKFCRFTAEKIEGIDYKDVDLLRYFIGENGKIIQAQINGTSTHYQHQLSAEVKRAPHLAMMPYTDMN